MAWNKHKHSKNTRAPCSGLFLEIKCEYRLPKAPISLDRKKFKKKVKTASRSGINTVRFCLVDPKVKQSPRPIREKGNITMSRWILKVKTIKLPWARENANGHVRTLHVTGWEGGAYFLNQSQGGVKQTNAIVDSFWHSAHKFLRSPQPITWKSDTDPSLSRTWCRIVLRTYLFLYSPRFKEKDGFEFSTICSRQCTWKMKLHPLQLRSSCKVVSITKRQAFSYLEDQVMYRAIFEQYAPSEWAEKQTDPLSQENSGPQCSSRWVTNHHH